jgi:hypothetical protein
MFFTARPTHLEPEGVFGIFVRRVLLVCNQVWLSTLYSLLNILAQMMFGAISSLFEDIQAYKSEADQTVFDGPRTMRVEARLDILNGRHLSSRQLQVLSVELVPDQNSNQLLVPLFHCLSTSSIWRKRPIKLKREYTSSP